MNKKLIRRYAAKLKVGVADAESEMLRTLRFVAGNLARHYAFGCHTREDIEQQAVLYGLEVLELPDRYDVERPLENFLHVHIRNRLSNLKRKEFTRCEAPCRCCDPFNAGLRPCQKWIDWNRRNLAKQSLMRPGNLDGVAEERLLRMIDIAGEASNREIDRMVNDRLPIELRSDYLRMLAHVSVPKGRRRRVREAVGQLLGAPCGRP